MKFEIGKTYIFRNLSTEECVSFKKGDDGVYEDRVRSKEGNLLESPKTTFMGPMVRFDYISKSRGLGTGN